MKMYRKTYTCTCEGQQEKMYLNHLARLINNFPQKVVTFNSYIDSPYRLTKIYQESDSVAIFDFDFNKVEFEKNIEICDKLNREQKALPRKSGRNIYHGYSNVNFDLWFILHKEDYNREGHGERDMGTGTLSQFFMQNNRRITVGTVPVVYMVWLIYKL